MTEPTSVMYAGATKRFFALLLDGLLLIVAGIIVDIIVSDVKTRLIISQLIGILYFITLESSARMATFGKSAMKIYVAADEGKRVPVATIALRYLILTLPSLPAIMFMFRGEFINMVQTEQQYSESHNIQGLLEYLQSPEVKEINGHFFGWLGLAGGLGFFLFWMPIVFTQQKTGVHDWLTKTRVFKRPAA